MKCSFALYLWPLALFVGCCSNGGGYSISGTAPDGADKVVLSQLIGKNPVAIDTVDVNKNDASFTLSGNIKSPSMTYISVCGEDHPFTQVFLTNEKINVEHQPGTSDFVVTGGTENELYYSLADNYGKREEVFASDTDALYSFMDSVITCNPSSHAVSYFLFRRMYHSLSVDQLDSLSKKFTAEVQSGSYLTILSELIKQTRLTQPGNKYLDFSSKTQDGSCMTLSSLMDGKSWILLDFWASWCPYCRQESPMLVELYSKYNDKGLQILSVSLDSDYNKWVEAIHHDNLQWNHVSDLDMWECKSARMYGISGIPGNILISPNGVIVARNLHDSNLEKILSEKITE